MIHVKYVYGDTWSTDEVSQDAELIHLENGLEIGLSMVVLLVDC